MFNARGYFLASILAFILYSLMSNICSVSMGYNEEFVLYRRTLLAAMVSRFETLKKLSKDFNQHLAEYIALLPSRHSRLYIISEHHTVNLRAWSKTYPRDENWWRQLKQYIFDVLLGLDALHSNGITHRSLTAESVLIYPDGAKLADFGMYYLTDFGRTVAFPAVDNPSILSPEVLMFGDPSAISINSIAVAINAISQADEDPTLLPNHNFNVNSAANASMQANERGWQSQAATPKSDIWALGILVLEVINGAPLWEECGSDASKTLAKVFELCGLSCSSLNVEDIASSNTSQVNFLLSCDVWASLQNCNTTSQVGTEEKLGWIHIVKKCLNFAVDDRATTSELVQHPFFADLLKKHCTNEKWVVSPYAKSSDLYLPGVDEKLYDPGKSSETTGNHLFTNAPDASDDIFRYFSPSDVYEFWVLSGGDVEEYIKQTLDLAPPLLRIPTVLRARDFTKNSAFRTTSDEFMLYDSKIYQIDLQPLRSTVSSFAPTSKLNECFFNPAKGRPMTRLPSRAVRERNLEYQFQRAILFKTLFQRYPASHREIIQEAKTDITPILRGDIWSVILEVKEADEELYWFIDKESEGPSDHQIDLDIPRCHQYDPLLSSPEGRRKMRRLLKAWIAFNPSFVYWQGLDSLLAPFLTVFFHSEAKAFCCLQQVVKKYLNNFFLKENATYLQGHLVIFRQLLSYHDPMLAVHLYRIGFQPELYAIPWFLTLFTHILKMEKIYRLWDVLLLSPPSFPIFLAVGIMRQLRDSLLSMDFNDAILLFSNLPRVSIDKCIADANKLFEFTPLSITISRLRIGVETTEFPWDENLNLDQLRQQLAPYISVEDLRNMADYPVSILDIRAKEQYDLLSYPSSIHVNLKESTMILLDKHRGNHIVIISEKGDQDCVKLANKLVQLHFPYVSVLYGGIDAVKHTQGIAD